MDVPWVLDGDAVLCLEHHRARPGDVRDLEGPFPHRRELVEAFPGEDPPEDKVAYLESAWPYVAAVVAAEILLVPCCPEGCTAAGSLKQQQLVVAEFLLICFIEGKDSRGPVRKLVGEDRFSSIDEGERRLASRLCSSCADGPEHGREFLNPVLAAGLEAIEASCLEAFEHFSICSLSLPVASWVSH